MLPKHLRVFISSPSDVAAERELAHEILRNLAEEPAWIGKISVEVVRWDNPSSPTPMYANYTPQQAIIRGLRKPSACDLFVLILWGRFGTPLSEPPREDGSQYLSGTEWEFDDARAGNVPILIYRRTGEPTINLRDPQYAEKKRQLDLVDAFFARFKRPDGSFVAGFTGYESDAAFGRTFKSTIEGAIRQLIERPDSDWLHRAIHRRAFFEPIAEDLTQNWLDRIIAIRVAQERVLEFQSAVLSMPLGPGATLAQTRIQDLLTEIDMYAARCQYGLLVQRTFFMRQDGRLDVPEEIEQLIEESRARVVELATEVTTTLRQNGLTPPESASSADQ